MIERPDEWDDLPAHLRLELEFDLVVFGSAFYEDTPDGPERIDPLEAIPEVEPDAVARSDELYGTPPVQANGTRPVQDSLRGRINRIVGWDDE